jgi:hypothetical protein
MAPDPLGDTDALLSAAPVANSEIVEFGPTPGGPTSLPPLPPASAEAYYLDDTGHWQAFNPRNYEARTVYSETTMAFTVARQESGMILLSGPSGSGGGGHAYNQGGFDGVAYPAAGPFRLLFPDEKVLKAENVGSASALTTNWVQNVEDLRNQFSSPHYGAVPRINEVRKVLDTAVSNGRAGLPPPAEVGRMITRYGEPVATTPRLAQRLASGTSSALPQEVPRVPVLAPETVSGAPAVEEPVVSAGPPGTRAQKVEIEPFSRALMGPPAQTPRTEKFERGLQAAPVIIGWLKGAADEYNLNKEIEAAREQAEQAQEQYRKDNPDKGVLIAIRIKQFRPAGGDYLNFRPGPTVAGTSPVYGFTDSQAAIESFERTPAIVADDNSDRLPPVYYWLPPRGTPPTP